MSGINRELTPHPRSSLFDKHLPGTPQVARLLRKEGKAHVFKDSAEDGICCAGYYRKRVSYRS